VCLVLVLTWIVPRRARRSGAASGHGTDRTGTGSGTDGDDPDRAYRDRADSVSSAAYSEFATDSDDEAGDGHIPEGHTDRSNSQSPSPMKAAAVGVNMDRATTKQAGTQAAYLSAPYTEIPHQEHIYMYALCFCCFTINVTCPAMITVTFSGETNTAPLPMTVRSSRQFEVPCVTIKTMQFPEVVAGDYSNATLSDGSLRSEPVGNLHPPAHTSQLASAHTFDHLLTPVYRE
jgi:hypothetical protein